MHALSLKQPWATLLVHGLKTIEVRRWPTARRERVLIHAAQIPDERPEAWALVPPALLPATELRGGIVGAGDLTGCKTYSSQRAFAVDQGAHLNRPSWFEGPVLYGFTFANLCVLPFRPCSGWMRFFPVSDDEGVTTGAGVTAGVRRTEYAVPRIESATPADTAGVALPPHPVAPPSRHTVTPLLLVSVRSVAEAEAALTGGAAVIDIKEPAHGALGRASEETVRAVIRQVAGRRPVSAAWGELLEAGAAWPAVPLDYVKWGLAGCSARSNWPSEWLAAAGRLRQVTPDCRPVVVAYADWQRAAAPPPEVVGMFARLNRCGAFLLDTWRKDGTTLLDWMSAAEVGRLSRDCRQAGVRVALAGSLGLRQIRELSEAGPDWFAVRGSVCRDGRREGAIDPDAVRLLSEFVAGLAITGPRSGS